MNETKASASRVKFLKKQLKSLETFDNDLHDLANSLAGDDTGFIAVLLHQAATGLRNPIRYLESRIANGETPQEASKEALLAYALQQANVHSGEAKTDDLVKCPDCGKLANNAGCCQNDEDLWK